VSDTRGYSGREIEQFCQTAVTLMLQRTNKDMMGLVDQGKEALRGHEIDIDPLSAADFSQAHKQMHPIATPEMLRRYTAWSEQAE
jgi:SpoVK/Ycf46/Vps4 family AAA+-type ATPase